MRIGDHTLAARSDQTWTNPSGSGYIRAGLYTYTHGDAAQMTYGRANPAILASLDAQPLNNLGDVPLYIDGNERTRDDRSLGVACTLRSIYCDDHRATSDPQRTRLGGDTVLTGGLIIPGDLTNPTTTDNDWSLRLKNEYRGSSYFGTAGYDLTMAKGLHLYRPNGTDFNYGRGDNQLECEGSTVTVGGDIKLEQLEGFPDSDPNTACNPRMGIEGGTTGATIICSGNYLSNCGPITDSGKEGMTASTLTMLGTGKTLEVLGDPVGDPNADDFGPGTNAIGTVNIGDPNTAASITLADDNLNNELGSANEVLLVGSLNIVNGTLDCNAIGAKISSSTLSITGSGTLDLNSGQVLSAGVPYTAFFGVGDQADAWNAFKDRVTDSDNPGESFEAVYVGGDDKTYWQVAAGGVLDIDAALDFDWVYQNTETTTADGHVSTLTITLVSEAQPGETYTVTIDEGVGPGLTNFTMGTPQVVGNTLVVDIIGGRVATTTANAPGSATLTVTVTGDSSAASDSDTVNLQLRKIGDVDGSGGDPIALDKQNFNKRMNGDMATGFPDRAYDLNASTGAPNAVDKQIMNQLLNGIVLP
jgi:hypothetical protein